MLPTSQPEEVRSLEEFNSLKERAKELSCLYRVDEILTLPNKSIDEIFQAVADALPPAWQFPEICRAEISVLGKTYISKNPGPNAVSCRAEIHAHENALGEIRVSYNVASSCGVPPFLEEERKLLSTIASRISARLLEVAPVQLAARLENSSAAKRMRWQAAVDLVCKTDRSLLDRITRRLMNYLLKLGSEEATALLTRYGRDCKADACLDDSNRPISKFSKESMDKLSEDTFLAAQKSLSDEEILFFVEKCLKEDKIALLIKPLVNVHASLNDITDAMQRYQYLIPPETELSPSASNMMRVALIRRFLTGRLDFIGTAKKFMELDDFFNISERLIFPNGSHGKLGGKSAGLLLADSILRKSANPNESILPFKIPKTWYITSEGLHEFVYYNNLEEVYQQKYKTVPEIRQDYSYIVQLFKNAHFPKDIVKGLLNALDDFGDVPLIVRSSSLLEDRVGAAFCGKYKSLFVANQGSRKKRLEALLDAVAEVYASTFGPDPIAYRAERGLIDFNEQMAVMIQEVVGTKIGQYFLPAFAGVAFSLNEFRWSPRISREDGLIRMVPGLGTRAVDRVCDDFSVLVSIKKPQHSVNISIEETVRFSPRQIDVINLKTDSFETMDIHAFLKETYSEYPVANKIFSILEDGILRPLSALHTADQITDGIVTFNGLLRDGHFSRQIDWAVSTLSSAFGGPVDIEFASDGKDTYLLQCRPQSRIKEDLPDRIPDNITPEDILFESTKYISHAMLKGISHIVLVDRDGYGSLSSRTEMAAVGVIVGKLNKLLPRKKFILIGPGRWGSRGDIRLGVRVSYSDINNTALLVEVGDPLSDDGPELSFGTHFFQDLVEADIRYLPIYLGNDQNCVHTDRLCAAENALTRYIPDAARFEPIIRVVDIQKSFSGRTLKIIMNADENRAIGILDSETLDSPTTNYPNTKIIEEMS